MDGDNRPLPANTGQREWSARLHHNLAQVRQNIAAACARVGRQPSEICLVAVTKYVDLPIIRELLLAGVADLGENRVQQLSRRAEALGARLDGWPEPVAAAGGSGTAPAPPAPRWHMIGHLQRNKVRQVLRHVRIIHSLDSLRLAAEVDRVAAELDARVDALVEVNVSGEQSKSGVPAAEAEALIEGLRDRPRIRLRGLMTMAPFDPDPEHARPFFAELREMAAGLRQRGVVGPEFVHLSMGMTQDYTVAIEEGATLVRVGSALFEGLPAPE